MTETESRNQAPFKHQRVLDYIQARGECTLEDFAALAEEFQISLGSIAHYLKKLEGMGLIEKIRRNGSFGKRTTVRPIKNISLERPVILPSFKELSGEILSFIQRNPGCTSPEIRNTFPKVREYYSIRQISRSAIEGHLRRLKRARKIKAFRDGRQFQYFLCSEAPPDLPVCAFCGKPIVKNPRVFNVHFPTVVYCGKSCRDNSAPELSEGDLVEIAERVDNLRNLMENFGIQSRKLEKDFGKLKFQELYDLILGILHAKARPVPLNELYEILRLRKPSEWSFSNGFGKYRWVQKILRLLVAMEKVHKVIWKGRRCYCLAALL